MNNLSIWSDFEKTDPAYTKHFKRGGGFEGTAINGTYIVRRLTEKFGPCGKGWRFVMEHESIEDGHTLKNGDRARVHIVRGHIAYNIEGTWYETSPQFGQTMLVDQNKYGPFTDEEAPKKSITDCLNKCAVLLGIGADVHLGLFDDNKYVAERRAEEAQENGGGKPAAQKSNGRRALGEGKPEKVEEMWGGPLKKTELKEELRGFVAEIDACEDYDQLIAFLGTKEAQALMNQTIKDMPSWWHSQPDSDVKGLSDRIEDRKSELANAADAA